jgi:hypothetical protein
MFCFRVIECRYFAVGNFDANNMHSTLGVITLTVLATNPLLPWRGGEVVSCSPLGYIEYRRFEYTKDVRKFNISILLFHDIICIYKYNVHTCFLDFLENLLIKGKMYIKASQVIFSKKIQKAKIIEIRFSNENRFGFKENINHGVVPNG